MLGAPVLETVLRVPNGDALQRVYCTADDGGLTVVEIENASPLPFAVAFSHGALLTVRPPADVAIEGIELPPAAVVIPVGHRSVVRLALAHDGRGAGTLARPLPGADQVARGWVAQTEAGVRIEGFDELADDLVAARATLLLEGPPPTDDPVAFLLGLTELVRLGQPAAPWVVEVAEAVEGLGRQSRRRGSPSWDDAAALDGAAEILQAAGEPRAVADVAALVARLGAAQPPPDEPPDGARLLAWLVRRLAVPTATGADLLPRLPPAWRGRNLALYGLTGSAGRRVLRLALARGPPRPALGRDGRSRSCAHPGSTPPGRPRPRQAKPSSPPRRPDPCRSVGRLRDVLASQTRPSVSTGGYRLERWATSGRPGVANSPNGVRWGLGDARSGGGGPPGPPRRGRSRACRCAPRHVPPPRCGERPPDRTATRPRSGR